MATPREIIAKRMISRSSHEGDIACGHRIGKEDADAIIADLNAAGFVIVEEHSVQALFDKTMNRADEIRREVDERREEMRAGARARGHLPKFKL